MNGTPLSAEKPLETYQQYCKTSSRLKRKTKFQDLKAACTRERVKVKGKARKYCSTSSMAVSLSTSSKLLLTNNEINYSKNVITEVRSVPSEEEQELPAD